MTTPAKPNLKTGFTPARARPTRGKVWLGGGFVTVFFFALVVLSAVVTPWLIAADRGLELTDEGLYLLSARDIAGTVQWGFPFGWHTAPLYHLAGGDVAQFRTLGAVVLSLGGTLFTAAAFLATTSESLRTAVTTRRWVATGMVWALLGWAGSLLYYSALLRAPGYNWVNLVGLLAMATATLVWLRLRHSGDSTPARVLRLVSVFFLGAGAIFASVAKPTTSVFFVAILIVVIWLADGRRPTLRLAAGVVASAATVIVASVATGLWPRDFFGAFVYGTVKPAFIPEHTFWGAVGEALSTPAKFVLYLFRDGGMLGPGLVLAAVLFWVASFRRARQRSALRRLAASLMVVASLWVLDISALINPQAPATNRWVIYSETALSLTILLLLAIAARFTLIRDTQKRGAPSETRELWPTWVIVLSLPVIFGFGASHGVFLQSTLAGVTIIAGILVLLPRTKSAAGLFGAVSVAVVLIITIVLVDSHRAPYRIPPMAEETVAITLSDRGQSTLLVDPDTAEQWQQLYLVLVDGGFTPDTALLGMQWRWNTTLPYAVGARVPDSLFLTLWGWDGSLDVAQFNLTREQESFPWADAWLLVSAFDSLSTGRQEELQSGFDALEEHQGISFPEDFVYVGRAGDIEVYRPLR